MLEARPNKKGYVLLQHRVKTKGGRCRSSKEDIHPAARLQWQLSKLSKVSSKRSLIQQGKRQCRVLKRWDCCVIKLRIRRYYAIATHIMPASITANSN